ncbi:MAG: Gfo/Idh/MocA family oxidoreductase [bacterium]
MTEIRWLLVGAGDISQKRVASALSSTQSSIITGVCDIREENARNLSQEVAAKEVYTEFENALATTSADAVYLATPVWLHAKHTLAALSARKHVLIEKPLGLNSKESHQVVDAAERSDFRVGCAYYRRCFPRYRHAKQMLANQEFGQIVLVRLIYHSWFDPSETDPKYWRVLRSQSGGGVLSDMGSHMFDILIGLFGLPKSVYAKCENLVHQWDVEDCASILMTLENGALVTASFNWNSKTWRHEFEIVGTEAKINWLPCDSGPVTKTVGREVQELDLPNANNVHQPIVDDFIDAILRNRDPICPVAEAAKTNILLDAVYRSAEENREISL